MDLYQFLSVWFLILAWGLVIAKHLLNITKTLEQIYKEQQWFNNRSLDYLNSINKEQRILNNHFLDIP